MKRNTFKYVLFFIYILNFNLLFSEKMKLESFGSEKNINLAQKYREEVEKETRLKLFFDAIRKHKNKFVMTHLSTKENIKEREELRKVNHIETGKVIYGPFEGIQEELGEKPLIDVNATNKEGYTPIIVAIESGNNDILKVLLENGANVMEEHPIFGKLTLHTAAYYENEEAVKILLQRHPELVNVKSGQDEWSALQDATLKKNEKIVELLLKYGANPKQKDAKGGTAMDMATEFGKGKIVKMLRDKIKENRREN